MQLDLFGGSDVAPSTSASHEVREAASPVSSVDPYELVDIADLEWGPVSAFEAAHDKSFVSLMPESVLDTRDSFQMMLQKDRLAKIVEEELTENILQASAISGVTSKLQDRYVPMVLDRLSGMSYIEIAEKYGYKKQSVVNQFQKPSTRRFIARIMSEYARGMGDVQQRIQATATEAMDTLTDVMRNGKEENRVKSAFGILRMGGYDNNVTTAINSLTINEQPIDTSIVESTNKLLAALAESTAHRTNYTNYIERQSDRVANAEVAIVEAPIGIVKQQKVG